MVVDEKSYRFGEFQLDASKRALLRSGEPVSIETRVFDLLLYLVSQRGRTVSRSELTEALWGEVKVSDGSLRRTVSLLRKALDARGPSGTALETVHGRGYRFAAQVEEQVSQVVAQESEQAPARPESVPGSESGRGRSNGSASDARFPNFEAVPAV